ncbi:MAG: hypothetical protein JW881_13080 [Spirochaetales bacterium]|nr:hypothetical protein [Spirochaetales bacterium]
MSGSGILDLFIGLSFIYFFLSLVCMWINEILAALFGMRQKNLVMLVVNLLDPGNAHTAGKKLFHPTVSPVSGSRPETDEKPGSNIVRAFFEHPLINSLSKKGKLPSYIPGREFALTLQDMLVEAGIHGEESVTEPPTPDNILTLMEKGALKISDESARHAILALIGDARIQHGDTGGRSAAVLENFDKWFQSVAERASGWYKRTTQIILFAIGFFVAAFFNADTIGMAQKLMAQPETRTRLSELAVAETQAIIEDTRLEGAEYSNTIQIIAEKRSAIEKTQMILGWTEFPPPDGPALLWKIIGVLITAFGVSMGSPFWWDILNRFTNPRLGGKKPGVNTRT